MTVVLLMLKGYKPNHSAGGSFKCARSCPIGGGGPRRCVHAGAAAQAARAQRPRAPQWRATGPN